MTQRIFEAVLAGRLPLTPRTVRGADPFTPPHLHVAEGHDVLAKIAHLRDIAGSDQHTELLAACLRKLDLFRLSVQLEALDSILPEPITRSRETPWQQLMIEREPYA